MKEILIRLLLAAFLTFAALALSSPARGQQVGGQLFGQRQQEADPAANVEDSNPASKSASSTSADQTQDALVFSGRIQADKGVLVLADRVTRVRYQLDDQKLARSFVGLQVKVVGRLDMKSNTIIVNTIKRSH